MVSSISYQSLLSPFKHAVQARKKGSLILPSHEGVDIFMTDLDVLAMRKRSTHIDVGCSTTNLESLCCD